jgi:hypothetical protein
MTFHEAIVSKLYPATIERERRVILGKDSTLALYTQRGMGSELRFSMECNFVVYSIYSLAGPEEWFAEFPEAEVEPWGVIREITEMRVSTGRGDLTFKVLAAERPIEGGAYRMRLQAINDPRV